MLRLFKSALVGNQSQNVEINVQELKLAGCFVRFECSLEDCIKDTLKDYLIVDDAGFGYDVRVEFDIDSTGAVKYDNLVCDCRVIMLPRVAVYKRQVFGSNVYCSRRWYRDCGEERTDSFPAVYGPIHLGSCDSAELGTDVHRMFFKTNAPIMYWRTVLQQYHFMNACGEHFDAGVIYKSRMDGDDTIVIENICLVAIDRCKSETALQNIVKTIHELDKFCKEYEGRLIGDFITTVK